MGSIISRNRRPRSASPGDVGGPQQRLRLPRLRPAGVVAAVGVQGAHQRPLPPLRAQVGVDDAAPGPGWAGREPAAHGLGDGVAYLTASWSAAPVDGLADEHDVGVAAVAQLGPAEAAHPDHRDPGRRRGPPPASVRSTERSVACSTATHTELSAAHTCGGVQQPEQVGAGHPQHLVPAQRAGGGRGTRSDRAGGPPWPAARRRPRPGPWSARRPGRRRAPRAAAAPRAPVPAGPAPGPRCPSSRISRCATRPSSRSSRRYHGVVASASETRR